MHRLASAGRFEGGEGIATFAQAQASLPRTSLFASGLEVAHDPQHQAEHTTEPTPAAEPAKDLGIEEAAPPTAEVLPPISADTAALPGSSVVVSIPGASDVYVPLPLFAHDKGGANVPAASTGGELYNGDALEPPERTGSDAQPAPGHTHAEMEEAHHEAHGYNGILFLCGTLVIGTVILIVIERYVSAIPYTCALFLAGMATSLLHYMKPDDHWATWPSWFLSVTMWESINPHMIMYAFLPALIFGEAMRLNVHLVAKCFWQVFILACPGVVIGTVLTAWVGVNILPYNWDWPIALVFGTIMSATDPVAVVALFNTLGVSKRLTMVISGESLLNDGTAIVIFQLMLKVALGAEVSLGSACRFIGHMSLTSITFGALWGTLASYVITYCAEENYHSDAMLQVVATICAGYLGFFLAENELGASGVLACVTSGFTLAYFAWPRFVSRETVITVWEAIEFIGNTVIFYLAGVIFFNNCLERSEWIGIADVGWLCALYVILLFIRAFMIAVCWIPMNLLGTPLTWKEGVVMVWSGLRGAVGLALAIIVDLEPGIDKRKGSLIMFHVGGMAALTMLINATCSASLLQALNLMKVPHMKERMLKQFEHKIQLVTEKVFEEQMQSPDDIRFAGANHTMVCEMVPSLKDSVPREEDAAPDPSSRTPGSEAQLLKIYREVFLKVVQNCYWDALEEGVIPRSQRVARILLQSTDEALETSSTNLSDWDVISRDINMAPVGRIAQLLAHVVEVPPFSWFVEFRHTFSNSNRQMRKVYAVLCFEEAHNRARKEVLQLFNTGDDLDRHVHRLVSLESEAQCRRATELLMLLPASYVELGKSEMFARRLLTMQMEHINELLKKGLLTGSEATELEHRAHLSMRKIVNAPKKMWLDLKDQQKQKRGPGGRPTAAELLGAHRKAPLLPSTDRGAGRGVSA